jgi:hypothetical protein
MNKMPAPLTASGDELLLKSNTLMQTPIQLDLNREFFLLHLNLVAGV